MPAVHKETPTPEMHKKASVYHNLGGGGVDFPGVFKVLREKHFKGWVIFDVDGPRKGDDGFDAIGGDINVLCIGHAARGPQADEGGRSRQLHSEAHNLPLGFFWRLTSSASVMAAGLAQAPRTDRANSYKFDRY